jgi:topoisomerase-4 subunit B
MPARYLKTTTMDPAHRTLLKVRIRSPAEGAAEDGAVATEAERPCARTTALVETLMGRRPELRFDYIQQNARFVRNLDL